MHAYFALGCSPVLLLFFLTVILQNECCYFFTCCILASYIVLAYLYYTIVCLFSCLLFCFFVLYVQLLACLIFCNRFVYCLIVFFCPITHIYIFWFFAGSRFLPVPLPRFQWFFVVAVCFFLRSRLILIISPC